MLPVRTYPHSHMPRGGHFLMPPFVTGISSSPHYVGNGPRSRHRNRGTKFRGQREMRTRVLVQPEKQQSSKSSGKAEQNDTNKYELVWYYLLIKADQSKKLPGVHPQPLKRFLCNIGSHQAANNNLDLDKGPTLLYSCLSVVNMYVRSS